MHTYIPTLLKSQFHVNIFLLNLWHPRNSCWQKYLPLPGFAYIQKQSSGGVLWERCSQKFRKTHRKTLSCRPQASNFIKTETLAQMFSCEFCEIFKTTFFYRIPPVAASVHSNLEQNQNETRSLVPEFQKILNFQILKARNRVKGLY